MLWHPPGAQFFEQVLRDNLVQQGVGNLREMTAEDRNCEAMILHNAFPDKLHKVVHNDGLPPTALFIMHMLSTCCKLSAPEAHRLLSHDVTPIDLAQLPMNFDRRSALYIQKLYQRSHFTVGGSWTKSVHLQQLQRFYCETSGSPATECVITLSRTDFTHENSRGA